MNGVDGGQMGCVVKLLVFITATVSMYNAIRYPNGILMRCFVPVFHFVVDKI